LLSKSSLQRCTPQQSGSSKLDSAIRFGAMSRMWKLLSVTSNKVMTSPSAKFAEKLAALDAFLASGEYMRRWQLDSFNLLCVTTGKLWASRLASLVPEGCRYGFSCITFDELGAGLIGGWS
jgi:hypothetical protein